MTVTKFYIVHELARRRAMEQVANAPSGARVTVDPDPKRTALQNDKFHAMCDDISKHAMWQGKRRTPAQWKVLLVSGHAIATGEGAEILPGLEGEFVNIRESTAQMSKKRGASLIDYTQAWGDMHGVVWSEVVPEPA